ncbi:arginine ABC transporter permease ArtQ [Arsenophonus nasoniae]|uniref:Arginine ABC transporter permease protein ArtQ n=1 Tax=Arsenophonus nasoniae TaxID=638 RepID=A0A4P7KYZ1_9GAMM|nr:arginine ABC transporter permease ArtQ [Arsenophonus nasoniae]QBY42708.1 Arginine ABC transporter permease protein ArtQ [Arsenophonus nasoniae]WGM02603.1 arginine ABC transporter permease ArtQ [Arsenophonus nasoniae]WGM06783.1 arginine ABC transporter permease ArtQ [Arsenophonus nasoniae]WGM11732.1 arginine ABC transporter permease ArtQ [Arsenophonus nasoniae]WGM16421.1 arginine ABC transporter permease ArtQ [Arsenophonus nasoniae]
MNNLLFLINAAGLTLTLAGAALILGLLLAMLFTAWESIRWRPVALLGSCWVTLIRGLPELLVVLFVYYGTLQFIMLLGDGIDINIIFWHTTWQVDPEWFFPQNNQFDFIPFFCGVFALALLYAAYASQTLRGALKAIPSGQWQSGQALGLNRNVIFLRLIMPQMWRHALPGLGNQWLVLLKDTALVSLISVNDLMLQTKSIVNRTQEPFTWYLIVALIYLAITLVSQFILRRIELRTTQFERGVAK